MKIDVKMSERAYEKGGNLKRLAAKACWQHSCNDQVMYLTSCMTAQFSVYNLSFDFVAENAKNKGLLSE
jgi:hypothetical protein